MELMDASARFSALSQVSRLEVLRRLIRKGPSGEAAGAIGKALNVPGPTLSFHLKEMERAGLILSRREGRYVYYAADYGGLRDLIDFLLADCCAGDRRLCGPYVVEEQAQ